VRAEIIVSRALILLAASFAGTVFAIEPSSSLWWHAGLGALAWLPGSLVWSSPYQLGQLLGLRPPASRP